MPYITQDRRDLLPNSFFDELPDEPVAGDLNYLFTIISHEYLRRRGLRYAYINDVVGALEGAKLEAYRRIAGDYEDLAIAKNGDVLDVPFPPKESTPQTGATDAGTSPQAEAAAGDDRGRGCDSHCRCSSREG